MADYYTRQLQVGNQAIALQRLRQASAQEAVRRQQAAAAQQSLEAERARVEAERNRRGQMDTARYQHSLSNDAFNQDLAWRRYKLAEQQRKDQLLQHSLKQAEDAQKRAETQRQKPIPEAERKKLLEGSQIYEGLVGLLKSQKPEFFGSVFEPVGAVQDWASGAVPGMDPSRSNWWREYQRSVRIPERFAKTGATMTPREIAEWQHGDIGYTTKPDEAVSVLNRRLALMHRALGRQARSLSTTYDPAQVKEALGMEIPAEVPAQSRYPTLDEMSQEGARLSGVGRPPLEQILGR